MHEFVQLSSTIQRIALVAVLSASPWLTFSQATWQSSIVNYGSDGKLLYASDAEHNRVIDFSYVGYKNSSEPVPTITHTLATLSSLAGDNTAAINNAIQAAASVTPDANGFRGIIKLDAGSYEIQGTIILNVSGVVFRGSGSGTDGTVFVATGNSPAQRPVMVVGGGIHANWVRSGSKTNITTPFVQVGSRSFDVASASGFAVGDAIVIYHPSTTAWIAAVDYGATATDPAWTAGSVDIQMNRTITAINGNTITIESPITNHLDLSLSQSYVYRIDRSTTKSLIGVEDLRIDIQNWTNEYLDEAHAWWGLQMFDIEDSWAKNVTAMHFGQSGFQIGTACRITIDSCQALRPVAAIDGSQRDNFQVVEWSSNILFTRCYATKARHAFEVSGTSQSGGIVFHRCTSVDPTSASEGHMKWPHGILYDCLRDSGSLPSAQNPGMVLSLATNGSGGTSHGWSAANSVIWNPDLRRAAAPHGGIFCQKPSTSQNFCIGGYGGFVNLNLEYPQYAVGYVEGFNSTAALVPESLFEQQLRDRLDSGFTVQNPLVVSVAQGWNMISSPLTNPVPGDSVLQLYPTSINAYAFEYTGAYVQRFRLENGKGYWEKFPGAISNAITGTPRTRDSISVVAGWNMVGSISNPVDTSAIVSVPPGLRASPWFGYSGSYVGVTQLVPGKGYWVKASGPGKFVLANPGGPSPGQGAGVQLREER